MCDEKGKASKSQGRQGWKWSFKSSSDEALKRGTPKSRMSPLFSLLRKDFFKLSPIGGRFPWLKFLGFTNTTYYSPRKTKIAHSKVIVGRLIAFLLKCFLFWRILVHFRQGGWKLSHIKTLSNCLFCLILNIWPKNIWSVETHGWALKKKTIQVENPNRCFLCQQNGTKKLHRISFSPGWNQSWRSQIQTFTYDLPGKTIRSENPGRCGVSIVWFPNKNIELRL